MRDEQNFRPEFIREQTSPVSGVVQKPLTVWERLSNEGWLRKSILLIIIAGIWQIYALNLNNPLVFPTFSATITAFIDAIVNGGLLGKAMHSIEILLIGYGIGLLCAAALTFLAITTRVGSDLLETLTSMFNP
jgi:NitT/TauT family transport system permease protein